MHTAKRGFPERLSRPVLMLVWVLGWGPHLQAAAPLAEPDTSVHALVEWLLEEGADVEGVPFREVIYAATGNRVQAVDVENPADRALLEALNKAARSMVLEVNQPAHTIHQVGRINEVSGHLEEILQQKLDAMEGFKCDYPVTAVGRRQRSGYPDLKLEHEASGRVFYVDPKVYRQDSERSTFRSFYYEPKVDTNKITRTASHVILGLPHLGRIDGCWRLAGWRVADLHDLKIRLKAEFQASNRDLYMESMTLDTATLDE